MEAQKRRPPRRIVLTEQEMIVGGFQEPSLGAAEAWDAALQVQERVFTRFHMLRAIRPDSKGEPMVVSPRREDMAYQSAALARRLMDAAVRYELPVLMTDIAEELSGAPEVD